LTIQPLLRPLRRIELQHHDTFRLPIAFKHFGPAAADDVFAAVLFHGWASEIFVFLVADWIPNVDFDDDIGGHWSVIAQWPLWLRSFAASSGIFLRRRNRNQLFHVLRRLSRGVWYCWVNSLFLPICARITFP